MPKTVASKTCSRSVLKITAALLLLAGLTFLAGCQGVSAGGSGSPGQPSGTLSLSAMNLNFGSITTGASKTLTVTATNSGTATVNVSGVAFSTKYFSLTAPTLPVSLAAGQSTTVSIQFTPNAASTFNATATIASDASNASVNLSLTGSGAPVAPGQLTLTPPAEDFGSVVDGSQQSQTVVLTNVGGTSVDISQASITGAGFELSGITAPLTVKASQSATFTVTFAPLAAGTTSGTVTINSNASNPSLSMSLSGTGLAAGALASSPSSLNFGSVTVGSNQSLSASLSNTGGTSITVSQVAVSGTGFTVSGISTPLTIAAGDTAAFTVKFAPTTSGSATGNVTITSTASNPTLTVPLSGAGTTAVGQLGVAPATLDIGSVVVGSSGTASGTLSATGANVTVTGASTNNAAFTVGGISLPVTIPAGQSVPYTVTFTPTTTGAASATLTFTSNAQPSTATQNLTGNGTAGMTHSVALSWNASSSSGIAGYNVYRAVYNKACGTYSKINSALDANTVYTDSTVLNGGSYCYAATAVDTSNQESGYSNIVSNIQIPAQ